MVDSSCIIEGTVKFRDGKKWKSRWCVMRKLSPVADCLHLQFYRDSKDCYKKGQTKASLSLQHFFCLETGFTLDKESNTVAVLCKDVVVILAFDSRERLMQWHVKLNNHLGGGPHYLVLLSSAPPKTRLPPGPGRLHVQEYGFCLTFGVPPRVAGHWKISYLRRYGLVEGRFCFEGGSRCGNGEGLYVLLTDQGDAIMSALKLATYGQLHATRKKATRAASVAESPRCSTLRIGPRESNESIGMSRAQTPSGETNCSCGEVNWHLGITDRCASCLSKSDAMSRSSTLTSGAPCWDHLCDRRSVSSGSSDYSGWNQNIMCSFIQSPMQFGSPQKMAQSSGPENYDIPKLTIPIDDKASDYYDTPRKIKECLAENTVFKPCGCIFRLRNVFPDGRESAKSPCEGETKSGDSFNNYMNIDPKGNYANIDFTKSLNLYENVRSMSRKSKECDKCETEGDYLMMKPIVGSKQSWSYLPMTPAVKRVLGKALSSSNPNLAPTIDRSLKITDSLKKNVCQHLLTPPEDSLRKRSNSAESARWTEVVPQCNCVQLAVRRSSSVPCKSNRDSSSSNDSGVFEMPRRVASYLSTLPRRSNSSDPLRDLSFQFQKMDERSASAEAEVPVSVTGSTSSGTSDMSDYIETLSLTSSLSSTENPAPSCTLRPRSGNEYLTVHRLIAPVPEEHR